MLTNPSRGAPESIRHLCSSRMDRLVLESTFINGIEDAKRATIAQALADKEAERMAGIAAERALMLKNADRGTTREHRLVHAWVLVRAGERDVKSDIFVESTSGRTYATEFSPYLGVEFVWNHKNYWINMQMPEPHSDSRSHPAKMEFNFRDANAWEAVLSMDEALEVGVKGGVKKAVVPMEEDVLLEGADVNKAPSMARSTLNRVEEKRTRLGSASDSGDRLEQRRNIEG